MRINIVIVIVIVIVIIVCIELHSVIISGRSFLPIIILFINGSKLFHLVCLFEDLDGYSPFMKFWSHHIADL